jgi:hypothetical protein
VSVEVFEKSSVPPLDGRTDFSLHLWETVRSRGIAPTYAARLSDAPELRREFLVGARMMGYELIDLDDEAEVERLATMKPRRYAIQPQQLWLVDALNAEGYDDFVVEIVRRASKTTTIFCWLLGRCAERADYQVTFSAQNGVKSSARLREWKNRLDRTCPDPEAGLPPWRRGLVNKPKAIERQVALFGDELAPPLETAHVAPESRGFRILMGEVGKGIYFDNGSQFLVFKPDADAYRGEAGDISWLDEAQELDPEEGADLLAGLVPLQDTRDGAALVVSGTAGEARVGPLWDRVNRLREGDPDIGGLDYCAPEDTPWEVIEDEDAAIALLLTVHPGIGTLTTELKMRKNWRKLDKPKWAREYLSLWPESIGALAIDSGQWDRAGLLNRPKRPERVAFGVSIKPGGGVAAICAAWRDARGVAYIEVVQHKGGTRWLVFKEKSGVPDQSSGWLQYLSKKYRTSTTAYDRIGEGEATATEAARLRPAPRLVVQSFRDTSAGCVQILRDLERGTLRHFNQVMLNNAVAVAGKRDLRGETGGVFLWTPAVPGADITSLDAATRALRNWDQHFARSTGTNRSVMGA